MIFDINVPYSGNGGVSFIERAEKAIAYALKVPLHILNMITYIAQLALFAVASAFTLGQSKLYNNYFLEGLRTVLFEPLYTCISALGFFAPLNAESLDKKLDKETKGVLV